MTTDNPYGYWIGRDEIHPVVTRHDHAGVAETILQSIFGSKRLRRLCEEYSVYRIMFRLGFVRVVNETSGHSAEVRHDVKLSKLQKDFLKDARYVDKIHFDRRTVW